MKVIQVMPNFALAGAEIMCENLIYSLKKCGVDVVAVSLFDSHTAITDRLEAAGIKIRYLDKKMGLDVSMIRKLRKIFKEEKPDVIHTHRYAMQYAIPAAIMSGAKRRVHTLHNVATKENRKSARKLNKLFFKMAGVTPVALSEAVQETVVAEYKLKKERIPIVYNGIDLTKCIPKADYAVADRFKILHIGRFQEVKNHRMLISAFAEFYKKHPDSELHLVGDGELRGECEELAIKLGVADAVCFFGAQPNVYGYLRDADIFTLPSIYEGVPMTLIEAMGTGLPIVASNVGGIPDMLADGESALLIETDLTALIKTFDSLYGDVSLREHLGRQALARSVDFSSDEMARKYTEIYSRKV